MVWVRAGRHLALNCLISPLASAAGLMYYEMSRMVKGAGSPLHMDCLGALLVSKLAVFGVQADARALVTLLGVALYQLLSPACC